MSQRMPKLEGYDLTTDEGCRKAYRAARLYTVNLSWSGSEAYPTNEAFDSEVRAKMESHGITEPTPQDWVKYARRVSWHCKRCGGTGQFITMVMNGQPTGPGGICFRCGGKGYQTPSDAHRNYWHAMKLSVYC